MDNCYNYFYSDGVSSLIIVPSMNLKILYSTDVDSSQINYTIQSLQQKTVLILMIKKICFHTHSEGDLSDKFELESEGLQETVTDCISEMKVAHYDLRNLRKQREKCFKNTALWLVIITLYMFMLYNF